MSIQVSSSFLPPAQTRSYVRHADLFVDLERAARDENRGLWSPDTCNGKQ